MAVRELVQDRGNEVLISAACAWEIATKARIGKLLGVQRLLADFDQLMAADNFTHLPMTHRHALLGGSFDVPHRDPFDRMLAAQAVLEGATLLTNDAQLSMFEIATHW